MAEYDCDRCPGYCCAYPLIQVNNADVRRLARHLGKTVDEVRAQHTVLDSPRVRRLKLTPDATMKTESCVFLDKKTRRCSVYEGRPQICRDHPDDRCEWYDRMLIEQAMGKGRKVIMLKAMPWTITADHPLYDEDSVTDLLESYATGDGIPPTHINAD